MAFNPKQEKLLHALPKLAPVPGLRPPAAPVVPMMKPKVPGVVPNVMPIPGQKHVGAVEPRWNKLQQYLNKNNGPAIPTAPVPSEESEK